MSCKAVNCSISVPHELEANSDISGIGVVIGFVASGWATFIFLILRYVAGTSSSSTNTHNDLTLLDRSMRKAAWWVLRRWTPSPRRVPTLETIVLAMSDQQLVTGLSIIISGFSRLQCGLSFYHWRLIALLAWFSSATHLATLLFLQDYLQRNRRVWYVRVFLMTALAVMLSVALVPTAYPSYSLGVLAWCSLKAITWQDFPLENGIPMVFSQIILLGGLAIRLTGMSVTTGRLLRSSPRVSFGMLWRKFLVGRYEKLNRSSKLTQALFMPLVVFSLSFLISMQALLDFLGSDMCSVLWLLFSLAWGTIRLFPERRVAEENDWGFGQFVPVLLLLLPVLLMLEGSSSMETQADVQPIPLQAIDGDSRSSLALDTDIVPLSEHPSDDDEDNDALYSHFRHLCNQDFRAEPWYLDNLLLMMSYSTMAACLILGLQFQLTVEMYITLVPAVCVVGIIISGAIPLCAIVNRIQRSGRRHSAFLIKLAVDPDKRYRVGRWMFCLWVPVSAIIYVLFNTVEYFSIEPASLLISWILVWVMVSSYAFFSGLFSIYSQVVARSPPTDDTSNSD